MAGNQVYSSNSADWFPESGKTAWYTALLSLEMPTWVRWFPLFRYLQLDLRAPFSGKNKNKRETKALSLFNLLSWDKQIPFSLPEFPEFSLRGWIPILFNHNPFKSSHFPWVSSGFPERRLNKGGQLPCQAKHHIWTGQVDGIQKTASHPPIWEDLGAFSTATAYWKGPSPLVRWIGKPGVSKKSKKPSGHTKDHHEYSKMPGSTLLRKRRRRRQKHFQLNCDVSFETRRHCTWTNCSVKANCTTPFLSARKTNFKTVLGETCHPL